MKAALINPEIKTTYQRGIYLYAKSLARALGSSAGSLSLVTDFSRAGGGPLHRDEMMKLVSFPPQERVRSIQMVPKYLAYRFGYHGPISSVHLDGEGRLGADADSFAGVDKLINIPKFYEVCRLAASKPFLDAVDVDFLRGSLGIESCVTVLPVAVRSASRKIKVVQTVHDLIPLNTNVHSLNVRKFGRRLSMAVENADVVIAVSDYTRKEIVERYPQLEDRVRVVYQPLPASAEDIRESELDDVQAAVLARFGLSKNSYIFFVGAIEERKNVHRLIEAFNGCKDLEGLRLVFAGSCDDEYLRRRNISVYFADRPTHAANRPKGGDIRYIGIISELEKLCLLRNALMFVFPSITEGFGIPLLEAQSMGCPVVTTNTSAIPEVVGSSAILINDPSNVAEIRAQMVRLAVDSQLREVCRRDGLINAMRFSKAAFERDISILMQEL